jgi:hypothetical protein
VYLPSKPIELNHDTGSIKRTTLFWNVCGQLSNHRASIERMTTSGETYPMFRNQCKRQFRRRVALLLCGQNALKETPVEEDVYIPSKENGSIKRLCFS